MNDTGKFIKKRRLDLGLTMKDIAKAVGVAESTISMWESGRIDNMKASRVKLLAEVLKCKPIEILDGEKEESNVIDIRTDHIYMIPVYESVSAGFGAYPDNNIVAYEPVYIECASDVKDYMAVIVSGDSMCPVINSGDRIIVRRQESVDSGDIAVVLIDEDEAVVKKVVYDSRSIELQSENSRYASRRFEDEKVTRIRVVGKVMSVIRKF